MPASPKSLSLVHLVEPPRMPPPAGEKPPLLLLLHGVGSNEHDLFGLSSYVDDRFLVISSRSPLTIGPGAFGWYPVTFTSEGGVRADEGLAVEGIGKLLSFLDEAVAAYEADPARVYLMGFSQGAIMSLFALLTAPEKVAGVVAMSGRLLPAAWERRAPDAALTGKPVIAVHGLYDSVLPIQQGREIRDKLSTVPVDLTYKEYPMAHEVSTESLADVTAWLTARL
jgi:Predicted esterase